MPIIILKAAAKPVLLAMFVICLSWLQAAADESFDEVSTEEMRYVRGLISKVYPNRMEISIRPPKGGVVRIALDPDTILKGASRIDELKKEQQVKVWYSTGDGSNRAIRIEKMMELGC